METAHDAEARRLVSEVFETSYRDESAVPSIGDTPPVDQPDTRTVPPWAVGTAVVSLAVGAGSTGVGCAVWLACQGLSSITLLGVTALAAPFVGIAAAAVAIGAAVSKAKAAEPEHTTNVYAGPVSQTTETTSIARGFFARSHVKETN